ncbi:MAG: hypothetical protein GXN98_05195 [Euryarchaeota archaeon]|nr:hypothetical protein [Euryarchaeota archaeon]
MRWSVLLPLVLLLLLSPAHAEERSAVIYYNQACSACMVYINQTLVPLLSEEGVERVELRDYINQPEYRRELVELHRRAGVPPELWAHMSTVVDGRIFIEGHLPERVIRDALRAEGTLVVYNDDMEAGDWYGSQGGVLRSFLQSAHLWSTRPAGVQGWRRESTVPRACCHWSLSRDSWTA